MNTFNLSEFLKKYNTVYIVISPTAITSPNFPLKGYAGPSGRLDVLARSVAALFSVPGTEKSLFIAILLGKPSPPRIFLIEKSCLKKGLTERDVIIVFRKLLSKTKYNGCYELNINSVEYLFLKLKKLDFKLILLDEKGNDIEEIKDVLGENRIAFILGSQVDIPNNIKNVLKKELNAISLSIEKKSLLASHVILYIAYLRVTETLDP